MCRHYFDALEEKNVVTEGERIMEQTNIAVLQINTELIVSIHRLVFL